MTKTEAIGWVKDGKECMTDRTRERLAADLALFPDCDIVHIIKKRGKRSLPQNNYYWSTVVHEVRVELNRRGYRFDEVMTHEFLKLHFNRQYIHDENGEVVGEYGGSTTEMNKGEFSEYLEKIMEWCSQKLGITISPAGTQTEMPFNNLNAA